MSINRVADIRFVEGRTLGPFVAFSLLSEFNWPHFAHPCFDDFKTVFFMPEQMFVLAFVDQMMVGCASVRSLIGSRWAWLDQLAASTDTQFAESNIALMDFVVQLTKALGNRYLVAAPVEDHAHQWLSEYGFHLDRDGDWRLSLSR